MNSPPLTEREAVYQLTQMRWNDKFSTGEVTNTKFSQEKSTFKSSTFINYRPKQRHERSGQGATLGDLPGSQEGSHQAVLGRGQGAVGRHRLSSEIRVIQFSL